MLRYADASWIFCEIGHLYLNVVWFCMVYGDMGTGIVKTHVQKMFDIHALPMIITKLREVRF